MYVSVCMHILVYVLEFPLPHILFLKLRGLPRCKGIWTCSHFPYCGYTFLAPVVGAGDLAPLTCLWTLQAFRITKQGDVLGNPWMSVLTLPTSWWIGCGTFNDLMSPTHGRGLWNGIVLLNCLPGTFPDGVSFHRLLMESLKIHWGSI